jgi:hypothetical protein
MAATLAIKSITNEAIDILGFDQFAMRKGGSETAAIILNALLEVTTGAATDLKNAYNEIDRGAVLRLLYDEPRLKPLWRIANWSYGIPSLLHIFGLNGELIVTILSRVGMRQGCPLAQMLFCLGVKTSVTAAKAAAPDVRVTGISDDRNFTGPVDGEQVTIAVQTFSTHVARIGLRFQGHKSKIINFTNPSLRQLPLPLLLRTTWQLLPTHASLLEFQWGRIEHESKRLPCPRPKSHSVFSTPSATPVCPRMHLNASCDSAECLASPTSRVLVPPVHTAKPSNSLTTKSLNHPAEFCAPPTMTIRQQLPSLSATLALPYARTLRK